MSISRAKGLNQVYNGNFKGTVFVCDAAAQSVLAANDIAKTSAGGTQLSLMP